MKETRRFVALLMTFVLVFISMPMSSVAWAEERRQKLRQEQLMRRPLIPAND